MTEKSSKGRAIGALAVLGAILLMLLIILLIISLMTLLNTLYVELMTRQEITLRAYDKSGFERHGNTEVMVSFAPAYTPSAVLFSNQGTFVFPVASRSGFHLEFWNDTGETSWSKLKTGCSYRVVMTGGGILGSQPLGENRMPPLNTIVRVIDRIEKTEHECDVSATSGKPVCRDDQVDRKNGIAPLSSDCDYETYAAKQQ